MFISIYNIEKLLTQETREQSAAYLNFFQKVKKYYKALRMAKEAQICHEKVINLKGNCSLDCQLGFCSNKSAGHAYCTLEYRMRYLKLVLENYDVYKLDALSIVNDIAILCRDLFPQIMNLSDFEMFKLSDALSTVVMWLRVLGRIDEADTLEEKQLSALSAAESIADFDINADKEI